MWQMCIAGCLILVAILIWGCSSISATQTEVIIDLSSELGQATYRASGFLHSFGASVPPDDTVVPLKPQMFRVRPDNQYLFARGYYERIKSLGATIQILPNGVYNLLYTKDSEESPYWPGDNGDWTLWEELLETLATKIKMEGFDVQWDVWNEPDYPSYWKRSREQFFETWRRSVLQIRKVDPFAVIVGPSIGTFDPKFMEEFLLYAKEHDVLPNVLSWHELASRNAKEIQSHVEYMRHFMAQNGIEINEISINEIVPRGGQFDPGTIVNHFAVLERVKVDSAAKSCWEEPSGVFNAWNYSLDGLLTPPPEFGRRAAWWAYEGYASITGILVDVTPSESLFIDGVAGYDSDEQVVRAIIGNAGNGESNVKIVFENMNALQFFAETKVRVLVKRIPATGVQILEEPEIVIDDVVHVVDNTLAVVIPEFKSQEAYTVLISKAE